MALLVAVLQGLGSISILGLGPWFGLIIALDGFIALALVSVDRRMFARVVLGLGLAVTLAVAVTLGVFGFQKDVGAGQSQSGSPIAPGISAAGEVARQLSSMKREVLSGFASGRATHWKVSWRLFRDHPWFEFDRLSLP